MTAGEKEEKKMLREALKCIVRNRLQSYEIFCDFPNLLKIK